MNNPTYNWRERFELFLKGFCMGIAEVIPGISGGTIAFLFGIFEDLVDAIKAFDLALLNKVLTLKLKEAFQSIPWVFLLSVGLGSAASILSLSKVISWLLYNMPVYINAFFFGLILATIPIIFDIIKNVTWGRIVLVVSVSVGTFFLTQLVSLEVPNTPIFLFLSGAIAVSAWILPGISGSYILVLLGKYHHIIECINERAFLDLGVFASGMVVGILLFVRVLSYVLHKFHDNTMAVLTGIVIGSISKIWPWKETLRVIEGRHGKIIPVEQINIWPSEFTGEVVAAIGLMAVGLAAALILHYIPQKHLHAEGSPCS